MSIQSIKQVLDDHYPHETLYRQAVDELLDTLDESVTAQWKTTDWARLARLVEPERVISFKIPWEDDAGELQHNRGYRVQFNSALGPYKGGLRFDPSVTQDVLKFLGFEQIFKNALTGLPLGGGKGGSDFNPKGKSDAEIRRFCRAFMVALHRELGIDRDVPAGDIGVGRREIGYMFGMYKQIVGTDEGVLTGKNELFGGSCRRTEATGSGVVYMAEAAAEHHDLNIADMTAVVSGAGNVALYTARALRDRGTTVLTLSDRSGYIHKESGLTQEDIAVIEDSKLEGKSLSDIFITDASYTDGAPWEVAADAYFPCATQNEVDETAAQKIVACAKLLAEGANMPLTKEAAATLQESEVMYIPAKAANAGGVVVSGLEMAQNASRLPWTGDKVDQELKKIMRTIHAQCVEYGSKKTNSGEVATVDYVAGANRAGLKRVMDAMEALGW
jgi:glutamate dehydrogenase (NADP+)